MGDFEFLKFLVCAMNNWNPYSPEVRKLPDAYWLICFQFLTTKLKKIWETLFEPASELVGYLTNPDIYKIYAEYKEKKHHLDETGKAVIGDKEYIKSSTKYVPGVGIIDMNTNQIIISENKLSKVY